MAREDTLIHEIAQNYRLQRPIVETTAYDAVKDTILWVLREMFARHPEYTYVPDTVRGFDFPDLDKTRIVIWQEYPYDTLFLPCITISIGSMRYHPVSFNQNMATIDYLYDDDGNLLFNAFGKPIPNYYEYAGAWDSSINININAQSPWDRDLLTDFIKINFIHLYRDWLYTRGIHIRSVTTGGESQVDYRNQHIYKLSISLDAYTEWTHRIPVPIDIVESVALEIYAPISLSAIVPEGIINEEGVTVERIEQAVVDRFEDDKPENAMSTVEYDTTNNEWLITDLWWAYMAREFDNDEILAMLQERYGINALEDITTENWFNILSVISSSARLGYLKVIQDVQVGIEQAADLLGIDPDTPLPDGYQATEYNRLLQLQNIKSQLETEYEELVLRKNL